MSAGFEPTELLGAYALDACEPGEVEDIERLLAQRPDLAAEAQRLREAAAWIGATEAVEVPTGLRAAVLDAARARHRDGSPALRAYLAAAARFDEVVATLATDELGLVTVNGLSAHDLVVHVAAQESLLVQALAGAPVPDAAAGITETDVDARTAAFVARFALHPLDEIVTVVRESVEAVRAVAAAPGGGDTPVGWAGMVLPLDVVLVARSFESWIHRDDLRRIQGRSPEPPPAVELQEMATLSVAVLPAALAASGRARAGRTARLVLTGHGGGDWLVPMEPGAPVVSEPDVTLTADVVEWCLLVGERRAATDFTHSVDGDEALAADLLGAAPAFATL